MYQFFATIDRRWIFLLMGLAVALPILLELEFPEEATGLAENTFDEIEALDYRGWVGCEYKPRGDTDAGLVWATKLKVAL